MSPNPSTSLYKDTTTDLNAGWRQLVSYYTIGDTRVGYLRAFELCLSQNCPKKMIWQIEEYVAQTKKEPLPESPRKLISASTFLNYMMVYEQIERRIGLIDKDPVEEKPPQLRFFDMGVLK